MDSKLSADILLSGGPQKRGALSDLGAAQAGVETTSTASDPLGLQIPFVTSDIAAYLPPEASSIPGRIPDEEMKTLVDALIERESAVQDITPYVEQPRIPSGALSDRIEKLEETQTKIIAALKHMGYDTNKHFRTR